MDTFFLAHYAKFNSCPYNNVTILFSWWKPHVKLHFVLGTQFVVLIYSLLSDLMPHSVTIILRHDSLTNCSLFDLFLLHCAVVTFFPLVNVIWLERKKIVFFLLFFTSLKKIIVHANSFSPGHPFTSLLK